MVAEHHLDLLGVPAEPKQSARAGVAKRVEARPRYARTHGCRLEGAHQDVARQVWRAHASAEQVVGRSAEVRALSK